MKRYNRLTATQVVNGRNIKTITSKGKVTIQDLIDRLYELEDKIEEGTLVELPCKVGEMMYEVVDGIPIQEWKIESICFDRAYPKGVIWAERTRDLAHWKFYIEDCGTKWFSTKAEAEKRLKEIRNETKSIDNSEK